jgi:hypothetical protein
MGGCMGGCVDQQKEGGMQWRESVSCLVKKNSQGDGM